MSANMPAGAAASSSTLVGGGTGCVVCGLDQNANQILLCDGCDAEYHTYCLVPPLKEIPEGDFFCKRCKDAKRVPSGLADFSASTAVDESTLSTGSTPTAAATQAGFAVQDENGRMIPIRSEDVRESKYRGVLKLLQKGAKKPFVARIHKDGKYMQLGLYNSEIEAAHAFDKVAIQLFGRSAQLNFPHLHEGFVRPSSTATTSASTSSASLGGQVRAAATQQVTSASPGMASPSFGTPGRGRGRGRGRGAGRGGRGGAPLGGGGRGKRRLDDSVSPQRDDGSASVNGSAVKRRKAPNVATGGDAPIADGPKYIGVQVFRGYAHAQIVVNNKTVNLGTFPNATDAAIAYDKAALKYFGGEIGAKDATHDGVVLNFPNKRAELLKQLIEESMHQKARQASGTQSSGNAASFSANRSMQSAKHNLSVKKLENWLLKLQRSVKLVEAAHRVQWDGVPLVKPEAAEAEESAQTPHDIKLELQADAGPTIRTEFTKKQQRLRSSAQQIEEAVNLMVQELKIYAEATPVDASFHPPPRSHVLLDLMSTSRFLKLCSTINELAHYEVKKAGGAGQDETATADDSFETLVQAVVDYRTRLQMATSSEKIKLQSLVESDGASATAADEKSEVVAATGAENTTNDAAAVLQRAKYVMRKVERIRRVRRTVPRVVAEESSAEEEHKEREPASTEDVVMDTEETTPAVEEPKPEEVIPRADSPAEIETSTQPTTAETDQFAESSNPDEAPSKDREEATENKVSEEESSESAAPTEAEAMRVEESGDIIMEDAAEPSSSTVEESAEVSAPVPSTHQDSEMAPVDDEVTADEAVTSETTVDQPAEEAESTELAVTVSKAEEPETEVEDVIVEEHWEYCLAIQPQGTGRTTQGSDEQPWRLIPLESDSGEFLKDVYLTDSEVAAIEVSDAEACGDGKPNLAELHQHELTLREKIKAETDRRQSLEGVIKIEQERLSQVFVVYRRMLEGIMTKSAEVQKKHQRISRDLLLVQLMKETFAPILDDLLTQCESVFLERLERLSDRFEDFQQEFDYYTEALLSVSGDKTAEPNGHMKAEGADNETVTSPPSPSELTVIGDDLGLGEDDSTGLRGAYVSFYMEEIEGLWKERCYALESLMAILRSLQTADVTPVASDESTEPVAPSLLRRRVEESLARWKSIEWPQRLATPEYVTSFAADGSQRSLPLTSTAIVKSERESNNDSASPLGELKQIIIDLTQESPPTLPSRVVRPTTLVVYHPVFLDHQTPKDHPECPERLNRIIAILATVRKKFDDVLKIDRLSQSPEKLSPSESVLLAVHSPAYLDQLKSRSVEASSTPASTSAAANASSLVFETNRGVVDLTPSKKKSTSTTLTSPTGSMGSAFGAASVLPTGIVMDTYVSPKSWDVARAAAGTVCLAVDRVLRKEVRNAACLVRPPGHHVGRHGRTLDAPSSGFCLLNNVIIGAVHARQYPWIRRVAVLDWDIHHGNGTEELMRDDSDGFFASIHLYASGKFFPGTGKSEQQENLVNVALENSGAGSGSAVFRSALQDQILPAMRAFRPDIIFISAGFDGHKDDILGGRAAVKNTAVPAGYLEEDYAWATQEVLKLADECCDGRVISVLEGGYDVRKETNALAKSVAAHVSAIASYEQERQKKLAEDERASVAEAQAVPVKQEGIGGLLRSLLAKSLDDEDVIIIDDDDEDDDEVSEKGTRRLSSAMDEDDEEEHLDEELDDDIDGDGVEVDDDDEIAHGDDHDALDGDDVVMTDEDHERDHSVDGDDDVDVNSSADLSFAASLSVDDEDDASHRLGDGGDATPQDDSRAATPEFNGLDKTEQRGDEDDRDEDMMGDNDIEDQDHHDLLGDDDDDHDSAEDETGLEELS